MKRKFFLHRQNEPMKSNTVVYRVWIGESVREQRILTQLMAWAFEQHATLMSWSEDIDFYLLVESERVFNDAGIINFGFSTADLTASEALTLAKSGNWDLHEKTLSASKSFIYQMNTLSPSRLREGGQPARANTVLSSQRKYLSDNHDQGKHVIRFV